MTPRVCVAASRGSLGKPLLDTLMDKIFEASDLPMGGNPCSPWEARILVRWVGGNGCFHKMPAVSKSTSSRSPPVSFSSPSISRRISSSVRHRFRLVEIACKANLIADLRLVRHNPRIRDMRQHLSPKERRDAPLFQQGHIFSVPQITVRLILHDARLARHDRLIPPV